MIPYDRQTNLLVTYGNIKGILQVVFAKNLKVQEGFEISQKNGCD